MSVEKEEPTDLELFDETVAEGDEPAVDNGAEQQASDDTQADDTTADEQSDAGDQGDQGKPPPKPAYRWKEDEAKAKIAQAERDLADERAARAAERLDLQRRLEALEKKPEPKPQEDEPDPLVDPKAYREHMERRFEERLLNERREMSLQSAHEKYQGEFEEAYKAAAERVDPALKAKMQASRNPGETLIQWYRERKTAEEIGGDLTAYKQRLREEALKDPEFRKAAMEAWQQEANGNVSQQSGARPAVRLPPSLSSAARSNTAIRSDEQKSDRELFDEIAG